jgi:hypothetical protein
MLKIWQIILITLPKTKVLKKTDNKKGEDKGRVFKKDPAVKTYDGINYNKKSPGR